MHERGVTVRQRDGYPGGNHSTLAWGEFHVDSRDEICPCVTRMSTGWQWQARIQAPDKDGDLVGGGAHWRHGSPPPRCLFTHVTLPAP